MDGDGEIAICATICNLADELRDIWLRKLSRRQVRELMALTLSQKRMLSTILRAMAVHPEGVTLKELAVKLSLSSSAVSVMVDAMVRSGLLEREVDERDRRKIFIRASASAQTQYRTHIEGVAAAGKEFFAEMPQEELRSFSRILNRFQQFLITSEKEKTK